MDAEAAEADAAIHDGVMRRQRPSQGMLQFTERQQPQHSRHRQRQSHRRHGHEREQEQPQQQPQSAEVSVIADRYMEPTSPRTRCVSVSVCAYIHTYIHTCVCQSLPWLEHTVAAS